MSRLDILMEASNVIIDRAFREHPVEKCAVACSFGKDSMAVLNLVRLKHPEIKVVFCNSGVEFPDTIAFKNRIVKELGLNYYEAKNRDETFWSIQKKYGWPPLRFDGKHGAREIKCCYYLKERPAMEAYKSLGIELAFTGITAAESRNRFMLQRRCGEYYFAKTQGLWKCHPIMSWTPEDVWQYINENNVPINPFYKKFPNQRIGCMPCTGHIGWEKKMALAFPKMYRHIQKMKGQELID